MIKFSIIFQWSIIFSHAQLWKPASKNKNIRIGILWKWKRLQLLSLWVSGTPQIKAQKFINLRYCRGKMVWTRKNKVCAFRLPSFQDFQVQNETQVTFFVHSRNLRVFKTLSEYIGTRTPRQCRSHFQKLMNRFKNIKKMIEHHQNEAGME